jgi:hypothetical protein
MVEVDHLAGALEVDHRGSVVGPDVGLEGQT